MAVKMKKADLAIAAAIIALILGGALAGLATYAMPDGIDLGAPIPETGVSVGGASLLLPPLRPPAPLREYRAKQHHRIPSVMVAQNVCPQRHTV